MDADNPFPLFAEPYQPRPVLRGSDNPQAKLTDAQVLAIRRSNFSGVRLARLLGVAETTISKVRLGRSWRHLPLHPDKSGDTDIEPSKETGQEKPL